MKYLLLLCASLSAQHTLEMNLTANNQKTTSVVFINKNIVMSISDKLSQLYDTNTKELFKIDFKNERLLKQSFKKAEKVKSLISPFISGNQIQDTPQNKKTLGYNTVKRQLKNNSSAAKIDATFLVTTEAKELTKTLAAYMSKIRSLIPFNFPIKDNELVLKMAFKWKLNSMAEMFLTGKNKRFLSMNTQMEITSIKKGISNKKRFNKILQFTR